MNILAADDERLALESLTDAIAEAVPQANTHGFRKGKDALAFAAENPCDVAFLDIEMRDMSGLELAKKLKGIRPKINIVFVTGYSQYAGDALALYVSGYVTKPVTKEKILRELENLRHPVVQSDPAQLRVQTFGNFEVFSGETPLKFQYSKTKELLAYLIDRNGAMCDIGEIVAVLWEDDNKYSYLRNLRKDLEDSLAAADCADVLVRHRGTLGIQPEKIQCDYYDWLLGRAYAVNAYRGEYMSQYSWAEMTHGVIETSLK